MSFKLVFTEYEIFKKEAFMKESIPFSHNMLLWSVSIQLQVHI